MLTCIDATKSGDISQTGKLWSFDRLDRSLSTVSIADGLLYLADLPGNLYCLDAETGKCYWVYETKQQVWGSTLVADGKIYLGTRKALWVFAAGKEKRLLGEIRLGSAICATPVAAGGSLYVASQRYLWATEPSKPHTSPLLVKTPAPPRTMNASRTSAPVRQSPPPGKRKTGSRPSSPS